jgi:integrase
MAHATAKAGGAGNPPRTAREAVEDRGRRARCASAPTRRRRNRLSAAARATWNDTITTHVLRHTAASLWIKAGATPCLVMKAGGWASLDMVSSVYGHLWPSDVVGLGRKVDALDRDALD